MTVLAFILVLLALRMYPRAPDYVIGGDYLARWWVIPRNPWLNVYLHKIMRSDDDRALHDHPWNNASVILWGAYREVTPDGEFIRTPLSVVFRRSTDAHRLEVVDGPVWTLFITGRRTREWGFWCPQGWVHWRDFTAARDGRPGEIGRGCNQ